MFTFKFLVFLSVFVFLFIQQSHGSYLDELQIIDSIKNERQCIMQGGTCVMAKDCPQLTAVKGLCPAQRSMGVECCYGISTKETRCRKRGGECFSACNPRVQDKHATDCDKGKMCCILV